MYRAISFHRVACSLLLQGILIMSNLPTSAASNKTFASRPNVQTPRAADSSQPLTDILRYISASWDDLTRTMTKCESLADTKTDQEPVLFLPADFPTPPALSELQKHCTVRVEYLSNRIAGLGELGKISTTACSISKILTSSRAVNSMKCMVGIAILLFVVCCEIITRT